MVADVCASEREDLPEACALRQSGAYLVSECTELAVSVGLHPPTQPQAHRCEAALNSLSLGRAAPAVRRSGSGDRA